MKPSAPRASGELSRHGAIRALAAGCVLLAAICVYLAWAWDTEREMAMCFREALAEGATPAVADADCLDPRAR